MDKSKGRVRVKYEMDGEEKFEAITIATEGSRLREAGGPPKKDKTPSKKRKVADGDEAGGSSSKKAKVDQDLDGGGSAEDLLPVSGERLVGKRVRVLYDESVWWDGHVDVYDGSRPGNDLYKVHVHVRTSKK